MAFYNTKRSANWNYGGSNWKLSRSKIDLFMQCQRCFYIDNKLGLKRPSMPPFLINTAVDTLLKKEFDAHRVADAQHPLQAEYGIDARPAQHPQLNMWRENFEGVQYFHKPTGLLVSGAIDDLWINGAGEYIVVDYKATAKEEAVKELSGPWHEGYKRQMEVYQWLLRNNGLEVSDTGYFVYCTGRTDQDAFDKKVEFDVNLISYIGKADWIEGILLQIKSCLEQNSLPNSGKDCEYCLWWNARANHESPLASPEPSSPSKQSSSKRTPAQKASKPASGSTLF